MTTLIFPQKQRQCASFSMNVANLFLSFKWATTLPNKLIDSQHHKRLRWKMLISFLSHFTLTTTQLNLSFLKNFKLIQNDSKAGTIFLQNPLNSFKRDKNIGNFLVRRNNFLPSTTLTLCFSIKHVPVS